MIAGTTCHKCLNVALALTFVASMVITGCSTTTSKSVLEGNKRIVSQMNAEVWNKNNLEILDRFYAPDFVLHFLPDDSELRGIDSFREEVRTHREAFPDWSEEIVHIVAERDLVVIQYISRGTNQGTWLGKPPTGRRIQINEVSIFRLEDDRIAEQWLLPDLLGMQQQLAGVGIE